jgi:peptidoglycan/LPS O-acetylase OafA/YrhL
MPRDPLVAGHLLSFLAGMSLAATARACPLAATIGVALGVGVADVAHRGGFVLPMAGVIALPVGRLIKWNSPRPVASVSHLTYEFFLTHGPIYLLLSRLPGSRFVVTLVVGTLLAAAASWLLHRVSHSIVAAVTRPGGRPP